jgi:hypothetical protein
VRKQKVWGSSRGKVRRVVRRKPESSRSPATRTHAHPRTTASKEARRNKWSLCPGNRFEGKDDVTHRSANAGPWRDATVFIGTSRPQPGKEGGGRNLTHTHTHAGAAALHWRVEVLSTRSHGVRGSDSLHQILLVWESEAARGAAASAQQQTPAQARTHRLTDSQTHQQTHGHTCTSETV